MDVATLVARLLLLVDDPAANGDAIVDLLARGRGLADYEVARFLVARRTEPFVRGLLQSLDPKERRTAVRWVELTFARSPAAWILREATKDRSSLVRRAAFAATRALRIRDVALPDAWPPRRPPAPRQAVNPFTKQIMTVAPRPEPQRGYNPTGWRFGLYPHPARTRRPTPEISALKVRGDVARLLGISLDEMAKLLRPGVGPGCAYVAFEVPKARGGVRTLHAPKAALKHLQRTILDQLLSPLEAHPAAHGFVRGRSVVTNAAPHVGARLVLKMDLRDFFPTIHFGRLVGLFRRHGAGAPAAEALAALVTYRPTLPDGRVSWPSLLPQGAPTSPALSNLVCRCLDARLAALAAVAGGVYTRYADDLTFSFAKEPEKGLGHFLWWANQIVGQEGFVENLEKRRVLRPSGQLRVTGVVTNTGLSVPREARRRFRAVLHDCERLGVTREATGHEEPRAYLLGFAAWVAMVQPEAGAKLRAQVDRLLARDPIGVE